MIKFFVNYVINQVVKKKQKSLAGRPANSLVNGTDLTFELGNISFPAPSTPFLDGLKHEDPKRGRPPALPPLVKAWRCL